MQPAQPPAPLLFPLSALPLAALSFLLALALLADFVVVSLSLSLSLFILFWAVLFRPQAKIIRMSAPEMANFTATTMATATATTTMAQQQQQQ